MTNQATHSSADRTHYGPVWNKPGRKLGDTLAACDGDHESYAMLTTHVPSVTCPDCKKFLTSGETP